MSELDINWKGKLFEDTPDEHDRLATYMADRTLQAMIDHYQGMGFTLPGLQDMIMNTLVASIVILIRKYVAPDNRAYILQLVHRILHKNIIEKEQI